jgi:hypothetical protein
VRQTDDPQGLGWNNPKCPKSGAALKEAEAIHDQRDLDVAKRGAGVRADLVCVADRRALNRRGAIRHELCSLRRRPDEGNVLAIHIRAEEGEHLERRGASVLVLNA